MRSIQKNEIVPDAGKANGRETEIDSQFED
jgi:hypothetical protein